MNNTVVFFLLKNLDFSLLNEKVNELSKILKKLEFYDHIIEISYISIDKSSDTVPALKTTFIGSCASSRINFYIDKEFEGKNLFPKAFRLRDKKLFQLY